ncbi:hypothetical protein BS47DRAFT_1325545 [Hydnum rufescens UP504]|uniref:Urease accessory protein UreD n=1 Tax=Hydnum rufescens UP504 TaxID=1448309 RepID=A0A9P6E0T5_9AGAM|nr:hypothetical protein BS47DRAFT_1325545 [Hydnum rufescens UP504]
MLVPRQAAHGKGRAVLHASGTEAIFSELSYQYPLKLLSPDTHADIPLAIAYILSYGGGLVSGDRIELDVDVGLHSMLMLLTQGSTKVFKTRSRGSHVSTSSISNASGKTTQSLTARIRPNALLLLLPDPVTCFESSSYSQTQTFYLESVSSSAVILDWFTSGRMARGEEWDFERYRSVNEVWIAGRRIARDVMLLEQSSGSRHSPTSQLDTPPYIPLPSRSLADRLRPYACYATLFLFGPQTEKIIVSLSCAYDALSQMQIAQPDPLIWSISRLTLKEDSAKDSEDSLHEQGGRGNGAIVRVAGMLTELVRNWLRASLGELEDVVGVDSFRTAFA